MVLAGPWTPVELTRLFVPTFAAQDGAQVANGFDGFSTLAQCQAECDTRNRALTASLDAEVVRLEDALSVALSLRARAILALKPKLAEVG